VDFAVLAAADHDELGGALEAGLTVALGVVPSTDPETPPSERDLTERVLGWFDMLGIDPEEAGNRLVVTPTCGLAGATPAWVRDAMALTRAVAGHVTGA
jgi:hypothetical protein